MYCNRQEIPTSYFITDKKCKGRAVKNHLRILQGLGGGGFTDRNLKKAIAEWFIIGYYKDF